MIRSDLELLINKLNTLDQNSDTVLKFDFTNRTVLATQNGVEVFVMTDLLILSNRVKGVKYSVLLVKQLVRLKQDIIYLQNHLDEAILNPISDGFEIKVYTEAFNDGIYSKIWLRYDKFKLLAGKIALGFFFLASPVYRLLYKKLKKSSIK